MATSPTPPGAASGATADANTGEQPSPNDQLLSRYLDDLRGGRNLSEFTLRNYATDLRHYFAWLEEQEVGLAEITRPVFRSYMAEMQSAGTAQGSVTRRVSTAKSFYRWLRLVGEMHDDPLALVSGPKQAKRLPHVLEMSHIEALIAAADGEKPQELRDRALLELMYASGVRVSEARGLGLEDVDLDHRAVRVRGKGNKERIVVMGEPARAAIDAYLAHGRPQLLARQKGREAGGRKLEARRPIDSNIELPASSLQAVFVNRFGTRLTQRAIQILVRKYALKAGLDERVHPHLLRHSFATHLLDNGAELRVVQELLGHTNPNTTQIYLHVTETRQRSVMETSQDELAAVEMGRRALRRPRRTPAEA